MADALEVLRSNGIVIPDIMVAAANADRVELSVAAAILEGESSGGHNVWGHDTSVTLGTYTPGGTVTRANYLAYRDAMRAGRIKRNGVGPCQATSAQYQDTADALGGCWDPLANCRSGFRGMGALIRSYGVQQGARRYNGSGPAAEVYGQRFLARYQRWARLLAGATATLPVPAALARPKGLPLMIERPVSVGSSSHRIACPTGSASSLVSESWFSISIDGTCRVEVWAQRYGNPNPIGAAPDKDAYRDWTLRPGDRANFPLPSGTEFVTVHITNATGPGSLLIEQRAR